MYSSKIFLLILICIIPHVKSQTLADRLVSTLPELPSVIRDGITGETGGFQKILSNVLGDGLISQLMKDPFQVAERVLPEMSGNSTDPISQTNLSKGLLRLLTTTSKPTTQSKMLVDGVEVDFDQFIRKNSLERHFSTKSPLPPSPTPPTAEKIADVVFSKLQERLGGAEEERKKNTPAPEQFVLPPATRAASSMDSVQRFIQSSAFGGSPPGFPQEPIFSAAPNAVFNNAYEDIHRLKELLNAYEEVAQTKDFLSKRKQLQNIEDQLKRHQVRINEQQQLETSLREEEKQLKMRKKDMEQQLHAQLKNWNLTELNETSTPIVQLINTEEIKHVQEIIPKVETQSVSEKVIETETLAQPITNEERHFDDKWRQNIIPVDSSEFVADKIIRISPNEQSRSAFTSPHIDEISESSCDCEKLSLNMLKGEWTIAFATNSLLKRITQKLQSMSTYVGSQPVCTSLEITPSSQFDFKTMSLSWNLPRRKINGYVRRNTDRTVSVEFNDFNTVFGENLCTLRTSVENNEYDYVLFSIVEESCKEAFLLIRNPRVFFNKQNEELTKYLKDRIDNNHIEPMHLAPFSC